MKYSILWFLALVFLINQPISAHEIRPAYLEITEKSANQFDVLWKQPSNGTLALHLVPKLSNGLLDAKPQRETSANSFLVRRWENLNASKDSFDGAEIKIEGLENTITDALINVSFLNGQQIQEVLKPGQNSFEIHLTGTGKLPVFAYTKLGIEHILTGYDHLSFVLGLLLLVNNRWKLLKTITAFTVAHSITLALAALGFVDIKPAIVEALVALSIVFVAVEVVRYYQGVHGLTVKYPWLIAFVFGLLHGFAFAGSLAEIGLPPTNIPGALLLFNIGVEIGQLIFVVAVLIIHILIKRTIRSLPSWSHYRLGASG
ncbi:MAG: HupE/UreJ family protein [Methylococcaceae bacterium]|nr:HupE/UreJ family protein [Methylococcaceae bacterium]